MPRAEERTRPPQDALEYGDIPGVPTANWGTGETCLESELKKSRVPLGCVGVLLFVVLVSGSGEWKLPQLVRTPLFQDGMLRMQINGLGSIANVYLEPMTIDDLSIGEREAVVKIDFLISSRTYKTDLGDNLVPPSQYRIRSYPGPVCKVS
jgi:hypothetical protein